MPLLFEHARIKFLHLFRQPAYVVGTMIFPGLFFLFFAAPNADSEGKANLLLGSFVAFAVIGVAFFQFGIDFAQEQKSPWARYVQSLPVPAWIFQSARSLVALLVTFLAFLAAAIIVTLGSPANLSVAQWFYLTITILFCMIPFSLLSMGIAGFVSETAAVPIFNLLYLTLSYCGGLWIPPSALPPVIADISRYLPTRAIGEIAWSITLKSELSLRWPLILILTAGIGSALFKLASTRKLSL